MKGACPIEYARDGVVVDALYVVGALDKLLRPEGAQPATGAQRQNALVTFMKGIVQLCRSRHHYNQLLINVLHKATGGNLERHPGAAVLRRDPLVLRRDHVLDRPGLRAQRAQIVGLDALLHGLSPPLRLLLLLLLHLGHLLALALLQLRLLPLQAVGGALRAARRGVCLAPGVVPHARVVAEPLTAAGAPHEPALEQGDVSAGRHVPLLHLRVPPRPPPLRLILLGDRAAQEEGLVDALEVLAPARAAAESTWERQVLRIALLARPRAVPGSSGASRWA
mmetsp:Transcript_46584/g.133281  ORF Transcript_46584/g.133281 Transcript_46584/m.133281 type:complete len:280 (-) Transcript_46584:54-893(-)